MGFVSFVFIRFVGFSTAGAILCYCYRLYADFDDHWTPSGPSEMDRNAAKDMGLTTSDLSDLMDAFNWMQAKAYSEILKRGKFSWNQVRGSLVSLLAESGTRGHRYQRLHICVG